MLGFPSKVIYIGYNGDSSLIQQLFSEGSFAPVIFAAISTEIFSFGGCE